MALSIHRNIYELTNTARPGEGVPTGGLTSRKLLDSLTEMELARLRDAARWSLLIKSPSDVVGDFEQALREGWKIMRHDKLPDGWEYRNNAPQKAVRVSDDAHWRPKGDPSDIARDPHRLVVARPLQTVEVTVTLTLEEAQAFQAANPASSGLAKVNEAVAKAVKDRQRR